jgi:hypothetical protein
LEFCPPYFPLCNDAKLSKEIFLLFSGGPGDQEATEKKPINLIIRQSLLYTTKNILIFSLFSVFIEFFIFHMLLHT